MGLGTKVRNLALWLFAKGFVGDIKKGEYGNLLKRLWDALDGKKTWIGLIATHLPQLVDLVAQVIHEGGASPAAFLRIAGTLSVIVGVLHRLVKGE
jgi:hypothetical protein